jgi:hypothetical protein
MKAFRFTPLQFWTTALVAGAAGVGGVWLADRSGFDPMYAGGIAAGLGAAIAFRALRIDPDSESGR